MRVLLVVIVLTTIFFSMTGIVYFEGGFDGALVVKPYPIFGAVSAEVKLVSGRGITPANLCRGTCRKT